MPKHYAHIIAAVDGSEHAGRAASAAAGLAKDMNKPLTLLHVVPGPSGAESVAIDTVPGALHPQPVSSEELKEAARRASTKVFAAARKAIGETSGVQIEEKVAIGLVVPELLQVAEELEPAIVVLGRRGLGGFGEFILGSVSNKLVHQRTASVLVV